jgi:hypothetical protein
MDAKRVLEYRVEFGEHAYTSRRNADERRWQIFRDGTPAPVGFMEDRPDPALDGEVRLFVFDGENRPIGTEPVHSYRDVLNHLRRGLIAAGAHDVEIFTTIAAHHAYCHTCERGSGRFGRDDEVASQNAAYTWAEAHEQGTV